MKKIFQDREKGIDLIQSILLGIVCIILAVLAYRGIVETGIVNLVFILFAVLNLREAFTNNINRQKIAPLCNASNISIIATVLNVELFDISFKRIFLGNILNWCTVWILITAVSLSYLSVILYRNKRWTQEEYENWKKLKQDRKFKNKQEIEKYKTEEKKAWIERKRKKLENESKQQEYKYKTEEIKRVAGRSKIEKDIKAKEENDDIKRNQKKIEILFRWTKFQKLKEQKPSKNKEKLKLNEKVINIVVLAIIVGFFGLFFIIPILNSSTNNPINQWIESVEILLGYQNETQDGEEELNKIETSADLSEPQNKEEEVKEKEVIANLNESKNEEKKLNEIEVVVKYAIFYIAMIGTFVSLCLLLFVILKKIVIKMLLPNNWDEGEPLEFLNEYGTAISILIVGLSILTTFVNDPNFKMTKETWDNISGFLLLILVLFVAVDIIKLMLEQCMIKNSLLRRCIRYIYILFIDTAMELIQGVFYGLRVSEWISSIMSLLIPVPDSELHEEIQKNIDEALKKETESVKRGKKKARQNQKYKNRFQAFKDQAKNIR